MWWLAKVALEGIQACYEVHLKIVRGWVCLVDNIQIQTNISKKINENRIQQVKVQIQATSRQQGGF